MLNYSVAELRLEINPNQPNYFPFFTYSYKKKSITLPRVNQNKHNVDILIQQNNKHQKL